MRNDTNSASYTPRVWQVLITVAFVLTFIALFIPGIDYSRMTGDWPPRFTHVEYSFHDGNATGTIIPTMITALVMCGGIATIWMNMPKFTIACASICLVDEIIYIVSVFNQSTPNYTFVDPGTGFFLFSILTIALIIFCFMGIKKTKEGIRPKKVQQITPEENSRGLSITDELMKYKELLDQGVITQEEFDKKKAELLSIK